RPPAPPSWATWRARTWRAAPARRRCAPRRAPCRWPACRRSSTRPSRAGGARTKTPATPRPVRSRRPLRHPNGQTMLRESLLYLSESGAAKRVVTGVPFARQMAERFVAGETLDDAVRAARLANANGLSASLDYLGEAVATRAEAEQAVEMVIATAERIAAEGLD